MPNNQAEDIPKWEDVAGEEDIPKWEDVAGEETIAEDAPADIPEEVEKEKKTGIPEAMLRGGAQGGSMGLIDEGTAGVGAAIDKLQALLGQRGDVSLKDAYKTRVNAIRNADKQAADEHPIAYTGSQIAGGMASSVGLGAAAKGGSTAAKLLTPSAKATAKEVLAKSALSGALQGYGASDADSVGGDVLNTTIGAGVGGIAGLASQAVGKGLQRFGNKKAVKSMDPLLKHQEVLNKRQVADELGQMLRDEKIVRFGSKLDSMLPRAEEAVLRKGARIGDIRAAADEAAKASGEMPVSLQDFLSKADEIEAANVGVDNLTRAGNRAYASNLRGLAEIPERSIAAAQEARRAIGKQVDFSKQFSEMTPQQQALTKLYADMAGKVDDAVGKYTPANKAEYDKVMRQFSLFKDAEKILDKATARSERNAGFGFRDMMSANAVGKGEILPSVAAALGSKLLRERGNAALAASVGGLGDIMAKMPNHPAVAQVRDALARGGVSMMVTTHKKLIEDDPEYAKLFAPPGGE